MTKQTKRDEGLFQPAEEHRPMAERLTSRWAEAEALARARVAQYLAQREQAADRSALNPAGEQS